MKRKITALLLAAVMLLTPALALAVDVDIDAGSVTIDTTTYSQENGASGAEHGGSVNVTSTSGTTDNTVTIDTTPQTDASGDTVSSVDVTISGVTFTGNTTSGGPSITITGDGQAHVALDTVTITGSNSAIDIGPTGGTAGPDVDLDMKGVDITVSGGELGVTVSNAQVDINVSGENSVTTGTGSALLLIGGAALTVTGDSADDALNVTSGASIGTVRGDDGGGTLTVKGKATVVAENTATAQAVTENVSIGGAVQTESASKVTITAIPGDGQGDGGEGGEEGVNTPVRIDIPSVGVLELMGQNEIEVLAPEQISALPQGHIQALTPEQIGWLSPAQASALTLTQIGYLTLEQIDALTDEQKAAMTDEQRAALAARRTQLLSQVSGDAKAVLLSIPASPGMTLGGFSYRPGINSTGNVLLHVGDLQAVRIGEALLGSFPNLYASDMLVAHNNLYMNKAALRKLSGIDQSKIHGEGFASLNSVRGEVISLSENSEELEKALRNANNVKGKDFQLAVGGNSLGIMNADNVWQDQQVPFFDPDYANCPPNQDLGGPCFSCGGTGRTSGGSPCPVCQGTGTM